MADQLLTGRIACVTGAAGGIGTAIAASLRGAGATVIGADINLPGANTADVFCDVSDESAVAALIEGIVADHRRLDIMVANAGISGPVGPLVDTGVTDWHAVMAVNLTGTFLSTKYAAQAMISGGGGVIVTTASIMGLRPAALCGPYSASKAAIISLTRSLAVELRPHGVRANAILPGFVDTPLLRNRDRDLATDLGIADLDAAAAHLQGRLGAPADVAQLALFLASDRASYLTGGAYTIDGGLSENIF